MENLIVKSYDSSLQKYEQDWIDKIQKDIQLIRTYNNPSLCFYTSMVYGFAEHLPYSMDIEQPEYVPADFLNMNPHDVDENFWFKWDDRRSYFNAMMHWGDALKTGMLLQVCNIFQKMILGQFPNNFELTEENYKNWGIDAMTDEPEYNRNFFETLKALPDWHDKLISAVDNEERRSILESMYADMMNKISNRYGSFRETDINGNIIRDEKGVIPIKPSMDVEMLIYREGVTYHDGIPEVIEAIKKEQLEKYEKFKSQFSNELPGENQTPRLK